MGSSDVWNNEEWRGGKWLKENATRVKINSVKQNDYLTFYCMTGY